MNETVRANSERPEELYGAPGFEPKSNTTSDGSTYKDDDLCADCFAVPWETFGASSDPGPYNAREPFISWKYTIPEVHSWPGHSACRICRFLRELLQEYGYESTTCIRQLRGGRDGEKPFKMTYIDIKGEDEDDINRQNREAELGRNEDDTEREDSDDEAYTIWQDSENGYSTFELPSFFATSLEINAFQSTMKGYKPTGADFNTIKSWLGECNSTHNGKCNLRNRQYVHNLRVVDCIKRAIVPAPPDCPFVALSYVWGPPSAQPSIESSDFTLTLPQTIEDSIIVTRELGFIYLWIDRYCINQDDEQEKKEQIAQMADIYAAAAVTIIAAAGDNPSHGLPGVQIHSRGLHRYEKARSTRLFANPCIGAPDRYPPYYVHESKWASRAWTFQECYNSPRRLFFTTEQITLVCNSAAYQETTGVAPCPQSNAIYTNLRDWIKQSGSVHVSPAVLAAVPHALASVMDILNVYSHRQMSYDSDALNAIVGTLNAFYRHSILHLWGIPLQLPTNEQGKGQSKALTCFQVSGELAQTQYVTETRIGTVSDTVASQSKNRQARKDEGSITLIWYHHSPCRRRLGFPSWSPLGWEEGIGWFVRQTPPNPWSDFITLLAACGGIRIQSNSDHAVPQAIATNLYQSIGAISQRLIMDYHTIDLRIVVYPDKQENDPYRDCVAISLDEKLDVLLDAKWGKAPTTMHPVQRLKGLLLPSANPAPCCPDSPHYAMMIAEPHTDHWERVGIALLTNNYIKPESRGDEAICELVSAHAPLFRRASSGAVHLYGWDLHCQDGDRAEMLDLSHLAFEPSEVWWKRYSKLDTIALG